MNYNELSALSDKLRKNIDSAIIEIPVMRVISSLSKNKPQKSNPDEFLFWLQDKGISFGKPGWHEQFEFQKNEEDIIILKVDNNFINDSEYWDYDFSGGLFAMIYCFADDDLEQRIRSLISFYRNNYYYEVDYNNGQLRHEILFENLVSPDNERKLVSIFLPIKKTSNYRRAMQSKY